MNSSNNLLNTHRMVILPTQEGDCDAMADHLRPADLAELRSVVGEFSNWAIPLRHAVDSSLMSWSVWSKSNHEYPAAILGIAQSPQDAETAFPWLLGTHLIESDFRRDFLRLSRPWLRVLHANHKTLRNIVHAENHLHISWLKWLGVTFTTVHAPGSLPGVHDKTQTFLAFEHTYEQQNSKESSSRGN